MVGEVDEPSRVLSFRILCGHPRKESVPFLGREPACRLSVLRPSFWGSCVFCVVLLSVLLSVSHWCLPLQPLFFLQYPISILPALQPQPWAKGQLLRLCLAVPAPPRPWPKAPVQPSPGWEPLPSPFLSPTPLPQLWAFIHDFPPFLSLTQGSSVQREGSLQDSVPSV